MLSRLLRTRDDWTLTLIRVVAGGVMLPHGMQKMFGWFGGAGSPPPSTISASAVFPRLWCFWSSWRNFLVRWA